jgi:hypothetical protein
MHATHFSPGDFLDPAPSRILDIISTNLHRTKSLIVYIDEKSSSLSVFLDRLHETRADLMEEISLQVNDNIGKPPRIMPTLCGGNPRR